MAGFGYGPFGHFPFGEYDWSRKVLYRTLPQLHLQKDEEYGYPLKKLTEGQRDTFDTLRRKILNFGDLRDPLTARTQYDEVETITLGKKVVSLGALLQRGVNGSITAFGEFEAPTVRFSSAYLGKELIISRSTIASNNTTVVVASIVSPTKVITYPTLDTDAGPLTWELREPSTTPKDKVTMEVEFGDASRIIPGWSLFDGFASFEVLAREQLAKTTEREGNDASIDASGRLVLSTNVFTFEDIGKRITLFDSDTYDNNDRFEIVNVLNDSPGDPYRIAVLSSSLTYDAGPLRWAILQKPTITLKGISPAIRGVIEQSGSDASITAATAVDANIYSDVATFITDVDGGTGSIDLVTEGDVTISGLSHITSDMIGRNIEISGAADPANNGVFPVVAYLTASSLKFRNPLASAPDTNNGSLIWRVPSPDIGKLLVLRGPGDNTGTFEIEGVVSSHEVVVGQLSPAVTTDVGPLFWEVRTKSGIGDSLSVQVSAPSLLKYLAYDFGILVDSQENEDRQRSWVKNVTQWLGLKGLEKGYQIPGWISGFDVTVFSLYRITPDLVPLMPSEDVLVTTDGFVDRHGYDGTIYVVSPGVYGFTSPTAAFKLSDVGLCVRITGADNADNNRMWSISEVLDSTHVVLDTAANTPDPLDINNGSLTWTVVRIFSHFGPSRPFFDDFDVYAFADLINSRAEATILGSGAVSGVLIRAALAGEVGNNYRIEFVNLGPSSSLGYSLAGDDITIELATDGGGTVTSTVDDVATFINSNLSGLLWAEALTPTTTLAAVTAFTPLEGGEDIFTPDKLCWEEGFDKSIGDSGHGSVSITSVTQTDPTRFLVETGPLTAPDPDRTYYLHDLLLNIGLQGCWKITDSASNEYFLETLPIASGGGSSFEVIADTPPALGSFVIDYLCEYSDQCGYCGSNRVHVILEEGSIAGESGLAIENAFDRAVRRLEQVTPAHVLLVITFRRTLEATLGIEAEIEPGPDTYLDLYAPLTAYYDDVEGDIIETDLYYFYATVEQVDSQFLPMENGTSFADTFELWLP